MDCFLHAEVHSGEYKNGPSNSRADYFQRVYRCSQIDWEFALIQIAYSCISPSKIYNYAQYRREAKNTCVRDDPGFTLLLLFLLMVTSLAYALALRCIQTLVQFIVALSLLPFIYILTSLLCMMFCYLLYKFQRLALNSSFLGCRVFLRFLCLRYKISEWTYSFDVHSNSLIPVWVILGPIQYLLLPFFLQTRMHHLSAFVSALLHGVAAAFYFFVFSLAYTSLEAVILLLLFPVAPLLLVIITLASAIPFNFTLCFISLFRTFLMSFS